MIPVLRLIRLHNIVIIVLTQVLTYFCLILNDITLNINLNLFGIIIGTVLIASAGNIINDYFDIDIDRINRPGWNVLENESLKRIALFFYFIINTFALILGFLVSNEIMGVFLLCILLLFIYSRYLKRILIIGNIVIALLMACTIVIVWIYFKSDDFYLVFVYTLFAFISGLIREIIKDIEDVEGDKAKNLKTFPIVYGIDKSRWLIVIIILTLLASITIFILKSHALMSLLMRVYLGIFVLIPSVLMIFFIRDAKEKVDYSKISYRIKIIMVLGISSMVFLLF